MHHRWGLKPVLVLLLVVVAWVTIQNAHYPGAGAPDVKGGDTRDVGTAAPPSPSPPSGCDRRAAREVRPALHCNNASRYLKLHLAEAQAGETDKEACRAELAAASAGIVCRDSMRARGYNRARGGFGKSSAYRKHWKGLHRALKSEAESAALDTKLVFVGDSMTEALREPSPLKDAAAVFQRVFNESGARNNPLLLGIPGDDTQAVMYRLLEGELAKTAPSAIVLWVGTNNLNIGTGTLEDATQAADGIKALADFVMFLKPEATLFVVGVPKRGGKCMMLTGKRFKPCRVSYETLVGEINGSVGRWVRETGEGGAPLHFVDCNEHFSLAKEGGHFMSDSLHLNTLGYIALWEHCLVKALRKHTHLRLGDVT